MMAPRKAKNVMTFRPVEGIARDQAGHLRAFRAALRIRGLKLASAVLLLPRQRTNGRGNARRGL